MPATIAPETGRHLALDRGRAARSVLAGAAFPAAGRLGRRGRTGAAFFMLLAFAAAYLRLSPAAAGSIWAEDGTRFLSGELALGFPATATEPYAGYMHLLPRLAGFVAGTLPLVLANDVFSLVASAVVAVCATATLVLARGHLPSVLVRTLLAAMVVLLPSAGLEAAGNTANSHWYLMAATFWALASRPGGRTTAVLSAVVTFLAMTSDPLTLLLAPLVLARLVLLHGWRDHLVTSAWGLGALVQGLVVLGTERAPGQTPPAVPDLLASYAARVPLVLLGGLERAPQLFERWGWLAAAASCAVFAVAAAVALVLGPGRLRWLVVAAGLASPMFYTATAVISWSPGLDPGEVGLDTSTHARYSLVPMLLLLAVGAAGLQAVSERLGARWLTALLLATALVVGPTVVTSFRVEPDLRAGPAWDTGVLEASATCEADPATTVVEVPLAPGSTKWVVGLPCVRLR